MKTNARLYVVVYAVGVIVACLWVPFRTGVTSGYVSRYLGYGWLWRGPHFSPTFSAAAARVDLDRFLLEILAWTAFVGASSALFGKRRY